ncbi:MAG: hypothetical protein HGB19_05920, partial [Chlorobiales bacterium]|nr:hypothetical protein [Chlorobiales bacterium]
MAAKKRTVTQSRGSGRGLVSPAKVKYLVGVGASAGGLDALRPLIGHLRERGVAAYIVAQHMSPTYVSVLAELLGKHSQIPVISASDGDVLVPDRVYIIPPNHDALVKEGRLELVVPESETHACPSVDILFRSIAESHGAMAVGVVLSGTGSDGLAGAEAIKAAGGTVIAQKLDEAGKESMPFSVLRAGLADQELGAEEIASYLNSLGEQSGVTHGAPEIHPEIPTFRNLLDMVFKATQMDVSLYKEATLMRQVEKRLSTLGLSTIADYITYVQSHPDELTVLQHSFLISVTSFFRDQGAFRALERALRGLVANKKPGDSIRAWVPGCATGEEAYTIAILLKEAVGNRSGELDVRVFATDIDMAAMEFAREAIYPPSALEHIEPARRERYFTREGSSYKISKEIRELCVFSIHDVVRHPPFMHMDIISCRNLLIYFKPALQEQLFVGFHYALNYDGYLLLGKSESIGVASKLFEAEDARNKLFRRKPVTISYPARTDSRSLFIPFSRQAAVQSQSNTKTLADLTCEVLMSEYAPPSILVSMSFDVLHFFGNAKRYLDFPKGHADFSLFSICLPELRGELKTLCYRITQEGMSHIVGLPTEIPIDGQPVLVRLALRRVFINKENTEHALLISFEEHGRRRTDEVPVNTASPDISELAAHEIQRLRQELADTREHLQTVIEELEASNEELQSLNEELQSSSEELQASNEELQSSNEELTTLNDELRSKSSELVDLNTTLTNIQDSIHMGLVVIDKEARIARFNELAVRVFGLMQGDIGKYLYGVPCHLEMPALREQITSVIGTGVPIIERARHGDYHYLMQIAPYMNESGLRTGAVLTFTDVSELQRAEEALRQSEETYRNLFKNMLNGLAYCRMQ